MVCEGLVSLALHAYMQFCSSALAFSENGDTQVFITHGCEWGEWESMNHNSVLNTQRSVGVNTLYGQKFVDTQQSFF